MNFLRAFCLFCLLTLLDFNLFAKVIQDPGFEKDISTENVFPTLDLPDYNPLLTYIQMYDVFSSRVYPEPPRIIGENEEHLFPKMSPLFMPLVFNSKQRDLKIYRNPILSGDNCLKSFVLDSLKEVFSSEKLTAGIAKEILLKAETKQIGSIKYDQKYMPEHEKMVFLINGKKPSTATRVIPQIPETPANTNNLPKNQYNPWSKKGTTKLQFSQTYISPNWSKGGESNMAGLASLYLEAKYNDLKNVQFDNNFEIKVGLNTVASDTLRKFNISTDQVRAVSKLGIKMYNNWFYSLSGEFLTQVLHNYKKNTMTLKSSLLSPAKLFISLGIDFKKSDKKIGYDLSVLLSPLTYKMNYLLDNEKLSPGSYGIEDGDHFGHELGSKISSTLSWKLTEKINWNSKFNFFTDFTYIDSEWENTLNLSINNHLTTQVFLHMKLDDRLERAQGESLLQIQELLSFGLVYRW